MTIAAGTKFGAFEIVGLLGVGGMGEVYRARDSKLKREVAVKVLPQLFTGDVDRIMRFEREAQVLASLNHPNIAHIYGVEEVEGVRALVMEMVEGTTLAERIRQRPLPLEEAALLAKEIAEGLEYAHDRGVIHRDLKPANIKLTRDGHAKILDFGLAKALVEEREEESISISPTISEAATKAGMLLGTAGYMSPEQAKGKAVDRRADIWAFGCVLYEMLTGTPAFGGETITDKLAAVIRADPELGQLPGNLPDGLREILQRCLVKDPKQRLQAIGEARIALEKWIANPDEKTTRASSAVTASGRKNRQWILGSLAAVSTIAAIMIGTVYRNRTTAERHMVRSYLKAMPNSSFLLTGFTSGFALSPDGTQLAYVAQTADGRAMLWVRKLDAAQAQMLEGTDGSTYPFWSPDSRYLGFFAEGKLKRVANTGGPTLVICNALNPRGGTWSPQNVIVFAPNVYGALYKVSATGGAPLPLAPPETSKGENTNRWPQFLPDGEHYLYLGATPFVPRDSPSGYIRIGALHSQQNKQVMQSHANGVYGSGHLLFLRGNTLMVQPFDEEKLALIGEAVPIADPVQEDLTILKSMISVSQDGALLYLEGTTTADHQVVWVDRTGKKVGEVPGIDSYRTPRMSPDGKKIAFTLSNAGFDVWDYDAVSKVKTELTFGSGSGQGNLDAVWSPEGQKIAYANIQNGEYSIHLKAVDGSQKEEVLLDGTEKTKNPTDWSRDGKFLVYQELAQSLFILPMNGSRKPYEFQPSKFNQIQGMFSPDTRWIAYCSTESGEQRVYVVPFPGPGGKWQISSGSGCLPRWRKDGKELFYLSSDSKVMSAEVKATGSSFEVQTIKPLFETRVYRSSTAGFDVSPDGQRFVLAFETGQPNAVITLVENWDAYVKKR